MLPAHAAAQLQLRTCLLTWFPQTVMESSCHFAIIVLKIQPLQNSKSCLKYLQRLWRSENINQVVQ